MKRDERSTDGTSPESIYLTTSDTTTEGATILKEFYDSEDDVPGLLVDPWRIDVTRALCEALKATRSQGAYITAKDLEDKYLGEVVDGGDQVTSSKTLNRS